MGVIILELDSAKAPITVTNFLSYARKHFYSDLVFHRVIRNFMIQAGGHTADMHQRQTDPPIRNEAFNGLKNVRGAIAMARTSEPHTATSQFYINTVNNNHLNYKNSSSGQNWGYCVFGKVIDGMDVVDAIEKVETITMGGHQNVPARAIIITDVTELSTPLQFKSTPLSKPQIQVVYDNGRVSIHTTLVGDCSFFSLAGKRVLLQKSLRGMHNQVSIEGLASGLYLFQLSAQDKSTIQQKIIVP